MSFCDEISSRSTIVAILIIHPLYLNNSTFHHDWMSSYVQSITKKRRSSDFSNYCFIALSCILSKIFLYIVVNSNFLNHVESHSLLSDLLMIYFSISQFFGSFVLSGYGESCVMTLDIDMFEACVMRRYFQISSSFSYFFLFAFLCLAFFQIVPYLLLLMGELLPILT